MMVLETWQEQYQVLVLAFSGCTQKRFTFIAHHIVLILPLPLLQRLDVSGT